MKKILSFCAAFLFAAGMMADPVVLPATLDVSNVSFRSEGMPDFALAEGDFAGTYFDMGAHDSANDTLLYAEWDVTIQPIKYNVAVVVYNTNSWRVQLDLLNQSNEVVKAIRYKGSSGQCGQYAIGALDLSDLAAGNYKVRVHAATAWSAMKLRDVIFEADYQGVNVALPGTLLPAYAELSANASITNHAIAFKPSTAPDEYANWNVSFAEAGTYNVSIDITASNGHNYGVELIGEDEETSYGAVNEGGQKSDTGVKELGAIEVPAAGNYIVHLTNATQWSEAVLNSITFAAPEPVGEPQVLYLKPGVWYWEGNQEKFAIYAFQDGKPEYWSSFMTLAENETNVYIGAVPAGYTNVIFVRFGSASQTPSWSDNMWNKTNDLTITADYDCYSISGWGDGDGAPCPGTWSKYVYEGPASFYITGNAALVGESVAWSATAVKATEDTYVFENLAAGDYQMKVLPTGDWSNNKGYDDLTTVADGLSADNDRNICFTLDEAGDVTVTYTATVFTVTGNFHVDTPPAPAGTVYRVGGEGADYATLYAACQAINATPITSNVTLLICADLTETKNPALSNPTDFTITIRPDADVDRTISFTQSSDNDGPSGGFTLGGVENTNNMIDWGSALTNNIIIDGYAEGGNTRRLKFDTPQGFGSGAGPILFYGNVRNSKIANCIIVNTRSAGSTGITVRTQQNSDVHPENIIIENNVITPGGAASAGIVFNGTKATTAGLGGPKDCIVRGNHIEATNRGIFVDGVNGLLIEGNDIQMPNAIGGYNAHAVMGNTKNMGNIVVRGNKINIATRNANNNDYGIIGVGASGLASGQEVQWIVENNCFYGMNALAEGASSAKFKLMYVRCGNATIVRNNTFYIPEFTNPVGMDLVSSYCATAVFLAGSAEYAVENNIFVCQETASNVSLIRGAMNDNVKNNAFYHAGGNAAILAGGVVAKDFLTFMPLADEGSVWTQPAFTNVAEADFSVALNQALIMPRNADVLKDMNGNDRRENTYAGAIEGPEATAARYLAGNGAGEWCEGKNWSANGTALVNGRIRYDSLPAGKYEFKITDGTWGYTMDYSKVVDESKANHVFTEGDGGNIMFMLAEPSMVMIQVEGEAVRVMGNFVAKPTHYLSGNGHEDINGVWCNGANWSLSATPLFGDSIVYENLQSGMVFQFKVTNGGWSGALNINNVLAECRANYVYGTDNITFQMAEAGPVVIKVIGDSVGVYGNFADPDAVVISSYTIVGDEALMGTGWNVSDANNDMTEVNGVWSLVKEDVQIEAGTYWYKVVGNHSYAVFEYPGQNQSQDYVFNESGVYTLTFTFIPGATPELTLSALKTGTGIEENVMGNEPVKFFYNGQICIRRNGVIYSITGARMQ